MFSIFQKHIGDQAIFSTEEIAMIESAVIVRKIVKGAFVHQEGEVLNHTMFLCKGCMNTYRIDNQGNIKVLYLSTENSWLGDTHSLNTGKPSGFNIEAIENSEIIMIHKSDVDELCRKIPKFSQLLMDNLKMCLASSQNRIDIATTYTAEERYNSLLEEQPDLFQRVPQYLIASYLGITPESLSRIRKKLAKEQLAGKVVSIAG